MISTNTTSIAVVCFSHLRQQQAETFCQVNKLPLLKKKTKDYALQLLFHDDLIELFDQQLNTTVSIDFINGSLAHRQQFGGGRGQAIAKAVGLKSGITPHILDATAGLAGDAFVLATLGCPVTLIERSSILFCLLENAIERATLNEKFQPIVKQGFHIINRDANDYLSEQLAADNSTLASTPSPLTITTSISRPDVIYIDPMYPERKKSALVKKDMQVLQRLHGKNDNTSELLNNALLFAKKRVVVKRPAHAETLNEKTPNTCIKSKKTRYDIYTIEKM